MVGAAGEVGHYTVHQNQSWACAHFFLRQRQSAIYIFALRANRWNFVLHRPVIIKREDEEETDSAHLF